MACMCSDKMSHGELVRDGKPSLEDWSVKEGDLVCSSVAVVVVGVPQIDQTEPHGNDDASCPGRQAPKASQEVRRKELQGLETAGKYPKMDTRNDCFIQPDAPARQLLVSQPKAMDKGY